MNARKRRAWAAVLGWALGVCGTLAAGDTLVLDQPQTAGISAFRAHWDLPIPLAEDGAVRVQDAKVKDAHQTAVWSPGKDRGNRPGALAFDALNRSLLVRFPSAAEAIAAKLRDGRKIAKVELVLPFLDEELWPPGSTNGAQPDGYNYRANWGVDKLYRAVRPQWHAVAWALRKPWAADEKIGPTFNAAVNGALYWAKYGAADPDRDRFPDRFGPAEVSCKQPDGRLDVTAALTDETFGKTLAERLRMLSDCGFLVRKLETYDARYFTGAYEWATATGGRGIRIRTPQLVVTFAEADGVTDVGKLPPPADVAALAGQYADHPIGKPSAVLPTLEQLKELDARIRRRPEHLAPWQWEHVRELRRLFNPHADAEPFWVDFVPQHLVNRTRGRSTRKNGRVFHEHPCDWYETYLMWVDKHIGRQPRGWSGFESAQSMTEWYVCKSALPGPARDAIVRYWEAWLMPGRPTAKPEKRRRDFNYIAGPLVHPMADDPRVGGKEAKVPQPAKGRFDTYYAKTRDWRGNKSFFRSGFTRTMSTQNFNTTAAAGALLGGQILDAEYAIEDGRYGLEHYPLRLWMWSDGSTQEHIDHYYYAITIAGNKTFADFAERPFDRLLAESLMAKGMEELFSAYHPHLRRLVGRSSRTAIEYVLSGQDGLYYALHTLSRQGALTDANFPPLPDNLKPFGRHVAPELAALQTTTGPWAPAWATELVDDKPIPYFAQHRNGKAWRRCWLAENFALASADVEHGRLHFLAHWRRKPQPPASMRGIGTMDVRMGFNDTRFVNSAGGWIFQPGSHSILQHEGKALVLTSPTCWKGGFAGGGAVPDCRSLQTSAILFNYERPGPSWEIRLGGKPVRELPAYGTFDDRIAIRDGATYIGLAALPATDLERTAKLVLEKGKAQEPAHSNATPTPALVVNAYLFRRDRPLTGEEWVAASKAFGGFAVEFADADDFQSFDAFAEHIASARLDTGFDDANCVLRVRYASGDDVLEAATRTAEITDNGGVKDVKANFLRRRVNGRPPYPEDPNLLRDTTCSAGGRGRVSKNGAAVFAEPQCRVFLQTAPKSRTFVGWNPLPDPTCWRMTAPDGVEFASNGKLGIAGVTWQPRANRLAVRHAHQPGGSRRVNASDQPQLATVLLAFGLGDGAKITVNGKPVACQKASVLGRPALVIPIADQQGELADLDAQYRETLEACRIEP